VTLQEETDKYNNEHPLKIHNVLGFKLIEIPDCPENTLYLVNMRKMLEEQIKETFCVKLHNIQG
jgi:hypothetical protein